MRTRIARIGFWIVALLFVAQTANAQSFEGRIVQRLSGIAELGEEGLEMVMNIKGEKIMVAIDMGPMGSTKVFITEGAPSVTVVMEAQKMGMKIPMPEESAADGSSNDNLTFKATGKKETVNGYAAEEWTADYSDGSNIVMWLTSDIDKSIVKAMYSAMKAQEASNGGSKGDKIGRMIADKGMIAVKTIITINGERKGVVDLEKIEKTSLPNSTFEIPSEITIQNMEDMLAPASGDDHEGHGHEGHQH